MVGTIDQLPSEVLDQLLLFLPIPDILSLSQCNHRLKKNISIGNIWKRIATELWLDFQTNDILEDYSNIENRYFKEIKETDNWYNYFMTRFHYEREFFQLIDNVLDTKVISNEYWKRAWNLLLNPKFKLMIPLLVDICKGPSLNCEKDYSYDKLFMLHQIGPKKSFNPNYLLANLANELLCAFRFKHTKQALYINHQGINQFDEQNTCEKWLVQFNTIDNMYYTLLSSRTMFFKVIERVLEKNARAMGQRFIDLPQKTKIGSITRLVIRVLARLPSQDNTQNKLNELMILRVYAGYSRGDQFIQLTILQKVLSIYGIKSQILMNYLLIEVDEISKDGTPFKGAAYIAVYPETGKFQAYEERHLRRMVDSDSYDLLTTPLSKQALLLSFEDKFSAKFGRSTSILYPDSSVYDENLTYSKRLPLLTSKLKGFYYLYYLLLGRDISTPEKFHRHIKDVCRRDMYKLMSIFFSPLEYKILCSMTNSELDLTDTAPDTICDDKRMYESWMDRHCRVTIENILGFEDIVGQFYTARGEIICILGCIENKHTLIGMNLSGSIVIYNDKKVQVEKLDWKDSVYEKQRIVFFVAMHYTGHLGVLFQNMDFTQRKFVLNRNFKESRKDRTWHLTDNIKDSRRV